jgi:hypothetical protein
VAGVGLQHDPLRVTMTTSGRVQTPPVQSAAEWAASLSVADVDTIISRCVEDRDFKGLSSALHLMAVKDPKRAEHWRSTLLLAVEVARGT